MAGFAFVAVREQDAKAVVAARGGQIGRPTGFGQQPGHASQCLVGLRAAVHVIQTIEEIQVERDARDRATPGRAWPGPPHNACRKAFSFGSPSSVSVPK